MRIIKSDRVFLTLHYIGWLGALVAAVLIGRG
jgi:hypothetical protein